MDNMACVDIQTPYPADAPLSSKMTVVLNVRTQYIDGQCQPVREEQFTHCSQYESGASLNGSLLSSNNTNQLSVQYDGAVLIDLNQPVVEQGSHRYDSALVLEMVPTPGNEFQHEYHHHSSHHQALEDASEFHPLQGGHCGEFYGGEDMDVNNQSRTTTTSCHRHYRGCIDYI